jgi:DNA-binding PadR family transcriptional regulator
VNPARQETAAIRLGPAEHALLGLLSRPGIESHGYELARQFAHGPLAEIIRLEPGMLYHHLRKLARAGLITVSVEEQAHRPARQLHAITPAGEAALDRWLAEPVRATREIRLDFLLKLYFSRQRDPALARSLLAGQRAVCAALEESLTEQLRSLTGADDPFSRQILKLRLSQTRAASAWLGDVEGTLS